ncbi:vanadium-dependent haloperoxidase [Imperialibacter roseus]|uniref:Vanadium-dependent haloperoxidase n=1 Tax=Imperialibacter roseus TaxID=1324217 RepID=A0ABZ0IYK4_9BACT|nr:vanadium-dependent haloperoxidase [Imperialibacter roseus]WOK09597.1 vanadium-dependent haloperoxidase [Imperialibacter roseus]
MLKRFLLGTCSLVIIGLTLDGCNSSKGEYKEVLKDPQLYHASVKKLTDIIVHDIFSPPVASRIYVYPNIAAYEVLVNQYPDYQSLAGQLNGLGEAPKPDPAKEMDLHLASIHAFLTVGKALIFSEEKMDVFRNKLYNKIQETDIPSDVFDNSIEYGETMAKHIMDWVALDNYKQSRSFPKYTVMDNPDYWKPTPPDYMEGIEPHWMKIRTLALDSCNQFVPKPPTPYDMAKNSQFYKELMEVYETGVNLSEEQTEIAKFWDCNPYVSHHKGHAMFATKKITPGGHWVGITAIATKQANSNFMQTSEAYTMVTIGLFDGFIACWDEKWRSILIRPETVINQFVDEDWVPLLQTPPFPEYTSGHSVISNAAASVLTKLYGEKFSYHDTTEMEYGLQPRNFDSFFAASEEAAISRLYGGIHYMPAITEGITQGRQVGSWVLDNVKTRKGSLSEAKKED